MAMTVEPSTWWPQCKLGYISLAISLAEIVIMGLVQMSKQPPTPQILRLAYGTWLVGGLGSFGFAAAGLAADFDSKTAFFALIVAIAAFLIFGLPLMVSA